MSIQAQQSNAYQIDDQKSLEALIKRDFVSPRVVSMSHVIRSFWVSNKAFLDPDDSFDWHGGLKAALLAMGYDQSEIRDYFEDAMQSAVEYFKTIGKKAA